MKFQRIGKKVPPEFIVMNCASSYVNNRTNVEPPYTEDELKKIEYFHYLYLKFMQDNGMFTRHIVDRQEDLKNIVIHERDLTDEGAFFDRNFDRFLDLTDFNVDPNKRVKNILEKGLKEMREAHARGEIDYTDYIIKD